MSAPLQYRIVVLNPAAHRYEVTLRIDDPDPAGQRITLPAWIPGSYMIRDFARNIVTIKAESMGRPIALDKCDKQTWQLPPLQGTVDIRYQVYAWDLSVRSAYLDQTRAYFNGSSVFLRVIGRESEQHQVDIAAPQDDELMNWRVATTLPATVVDARGFGQYQVPSYDALIDYPVEISDHSPMQFTAAGIPHQMVISGRHRCDAERLTADLTRICEQHARMYGELPVDRYLFMTMATGDGYGGLEHRDSTSLMCARDDLPRPGMKAPEEGYRRFLGLCSHEYFHLWNVKRIRPERLKQADLSVEIHTQLLWAFEGFTSYYDELALVRAGCIDSLSFLELLAQTITKVLRSTGRHKQTVAESSFDAWTKFYKQDENAPNAIVSYYTKGALVALGLDMQLRDATDDRVTLDDLMRELWQRYGKPDIGVPEDGIERLASELAGTDLSDFFARYVHGTDELPLDDWLASVGVGIQRRPAGDAIDQGKSSKTPPEAVEAKPVLGARWMVENGFARLSHVLDGGAAQAAGLSAGDRLIALDGIQLPADKVAQRIAQLPSGRTFSLHVFRRDELLAVELAPQPAPADTVTLWLLADDQLDSRQQARRSAWLASA